MFVQHFFSRYVDVSFSLFRPLFSCLFCCKSLLSLFLYCHSIFTFLHCGLLFPIWFFSICYLAGGVGCLACFRVMLVVGAFSADFVYGFKWMVSANVGITKRLATLSEWLFEMESQWKCEFSASFIYWETAQCTVHNHNPNNVCVYAVYFMLFVCVCLCRKCNHTDKIYKVCWLFFPIRLWFKQADRIHFVVALPDYMS